VVEVNGKNITGCSSGFGRATALHLASHRWRVFATVRKPADMAMLAQEAGRRKCADHVIPVLCDITNNKQVGTLSEVVTKAAPHLDALLNNAGTSFAGPVELLALDDLRAQMETNLIGHLAVTQTLLPLLKTGRGIIINVTSVLGHFAWPMTGAYAASKFALEALSETLRIELAAIRNPRGHGNAVSQVYCDVEYHPRAQQLAFAQVRK
jgi:NAD(P)-dependent dehydrogenase (short-subunit alcohol dehydrogenase family)